MVLTSDSPATLCCRGSDLVTRNLSVAVTTCSMDILPSLQLVGYNLGNVLLVSCIFVPSHPILSGQDLTYLLRLSNMQINISKHYNISTWDLE